MLAHVLWTIAGCLVWNLASVVVALRLAWRQGYSDGVADMQLTFENSLKGHFGKGKRNG